MWKSCSVCITFCKILFSSSFLQYEMLVRLAFQSFFLLLIPVIWFLLDSLWRNRWALSNQQKVRLEISEIPRAQWNGTFQVAQTRSTQAIVPFNLCAGKRKGVLGTAMLSNGEGHFGLTDRNEQTGKSGSRPWSQIFRSHRTKMPCSNWNFRNFELNGKRPFICFLLDDYNSFKARAWSTKIGKTVLIYRNPTFYYSIPIFWTQLNF